MKIFRRSHKVWVVALLVLVMAVGTAVVQALISIDTFNDPVQESDVDVNACTFASGSEMIGGERDIFVERTSGANTVVANVNDPVVGHFSFSVGSGGTVGSALLQWDGIDNDCALNPTGLGGISLNPEDGMVLSILDVDQNTTLTLRVYTDGTNYSEYNYVIPEPIAPPGESIYFPFELFQVASGSGADFASVGAIEVVAQGSGIDLSIDFINSDLTRDFGDLPAGYGITTAANNGARHILGTTYFGSGVSADGDGTTSATATGEADTVADGVDAITGSNWGDGGGQVSVTVSSPAGVGYGCVVGWIDWNGNNTFDVGGTTGGVSELVVNEGVLNGTNTIDITTPTTVDYGGTYPATLNTRFRVFEPAADLFDTYGLSYNALTSFCPSGETEANIAQLLVGIARDGEVEDYQWGFTPTAVTLSAPVAAGNSGGWMVPMLLVSVLGIVTAGLWQRNKRRSAPEVEDDTAVVADTAVSQYESPAIIYEDELTTRAGSPTGLDPNGINPADLFD